MRKPAVIEKVGETQGRCLRYVVHSQDQPVMASRLVSHVEWSWLPQSLLEAKAALEKLTKLGLVRKLGKGYTHTDAGIKVCKYADDINMWQTTRFAPPKAPAYKPATTKRRTNKRRPKSRSKT